MSFITSQYNWYHAALVHPPTAGGDRGFDRQNTYRHPDVWQLSNGGATDVLIKRNKVEAGLFYTQVFYGNAEKVNGWSQGTPDPNLAHRRINILDNWIISNHQSAILMGGMNGALIDGNLIQPANPDNPGGVQRPSMVIKGPNYNLRYINNVWPANSFSRGFAPQHTYGLGPSGQQPPATNINQAVIEYTGNVLTAGGNLYTARPSGWVELIGNPALGTPNIGPYGYNGGVPQYRAGLEPSP